MDKQREEFEAWFKTTWNGVDLTQTIGNDATFQLNGDSKYFEDCVQHSWEAWQQAQKVVVPDGFVVVKKEPYAYLIKHRLWQKDSDPEIFLAVDFFGDDGIEKDKLTVCKPLYLGDDEAGEKK